MNEPSQINGRDGLLTEVQLKVLFSFSQFPYEAIEKELYLGNLNHLSEHYFKALNIKTVIDCRKSTNNESKKIP